MTALAVARPTLGAWRSELWVPVGAVVVALLGGLALVAAAGVSLPAAVAAFADDGNDGGHRQRLPSDRD